MAVCAYDPSMREAYAERLLKVQGQPRQHSKTIFHDTPNPPKTHNIANAVPATRTQVLLPKLLPKQ